MIHYKDKIFFYLSIIIVLFLLLSGCVREPHYRLENIDSNQDGQLDIIRYFDGEKKIKEYIDYLGGIYKAETLYWDKQGYLIKIVTEYSKEKPFTSFYKKGVIIKQDGKELIRQELDNYKTYKNIAEKRWLKTYQGKMYVYIADGKILYTTLDPKNNGRIVSVVFYDDHGRISKSFEDKNGVGKFDTLRIHSFGELKEQKKINISTDSSIDYLKNYVLN